MLASAGQEVTATSLDGADHDNRVDSSVLSRDAKTLYTLLIDSVAANGGSANGVGAGIRESGDTGTVETEVASAELDTPAGVSRSEKRK